MFVLYCRKELEESGEELIRIKECYVQLSEESRSLEEKLKEQFEKEKQVLLSEASLHMYIGKYRSQFLCALLYDFDHYYSFCSKEQGQMYSQDF